MNRISVLFFLVDIYFSYLFIHEICKFRVMCGIPLRRYNYHYKYNTRATPGRSQLVVIYKKHNRCDYSNYRPISITSHFSKMFEKLIKIRIFYTKIKFLKRVNLVSENLHQHVMHFLISLVIYKAIMINIARQSLLILKRHLIHYIPNSILLEKLYLYSFRGLSGDFIRSY